MYYDLRNPELIIREENYENGRPDGQWTTRYKYGTVESIKNFKNGKKHGTIQYMKPDGEVVYEAVFKENKLVKTKVNKKSQKKE